MFRKVVVVLAMVLVLGNFWLSTSALARGGGHGGSGRGNSFQGNHLRGGFAGEIRGGNGDRTGSLHGRLSGYGDRDVWGHWGTYYGPMIPAI